ncbi:hypothetical protein POVWA1_061390 [Plasmodium ovale wallikeri]|uniref:Uncharacterized protein n=1 Tax=Plasmodium ovale wallikeri TaxID=864142 RepID=A0A1A9A2N8_PLAOA|nr:hypothetical protein POVWA1_061390 [Plasmodium ovale wallikeri]
MLICAATSERDAHMAVQTNLKKKKIKHKLNGAKWAKLSNVGSGTEKKKKKNIKNHKAWDAAICKRGYGTFKNGRCAVHIRT